MFQTKNINFSGVLLMVMSLIFQASWVYDVNFYTVLIGCISWILGMIMFMYSDEWWWQ